MMTNLNWSALIFAALMAVAYWSTEGVERQPECNESRPVFGSSPCCQEAQDHQHDRVQLGGRTRSGPAGQVRPGRSAVTGGGSNAYAATISRFVTKMIGRSQG